MKKIFPILIIFLILFIVPTSFAADTNMTDDVSISDDSQVLAQHSNYTTTPSPSNVEYVKDSDSVISVSVTQDWSYYLDYYSLYLYIDNEDTSNAGHYVYDVNGNSIGAGTGDFQYNLKKISDELSVGTHTLVFRLSDGGVNSCYGSNAVCEFNPLTVTVTESGDVDKTVHVSKTGSDTSGDGSQSKPYATITKALNEAGDGWQIIVNEGTYENSWTPYTINSNVVITGLGKVYLKAYSSKHFNVDFENSHNANTVTFNNLIFTDGTASGEDAASVKITPSWNGYTTTAKFENCSFYNNKGFSLISASGYADLILHNCQIINFTDNYYLFYTNDKGSVDISYSVFSNIEYMDSIFYFYSTGTANYNFWGSNDKITTGSDVSITNWVILQSSLSTDDISSGSSPIVTYEFKLNNTQGVVSSLADSMPDTTINLDYELNYVDSKITLKNNKASLKYNALAEGDEVITASFNSQQLKELKFTVKKAPTGREIYVATTGNDNRGNGSKNSPYATISKALSRNEELGFNNEIIIAEGSYIMYNSEINGNVNLTGDGNVIISSRSGYTYFNVLDADVVVTNLHFTNSQKPINVSSNSKLTVIKSTFENNTRAVESYGNLDISNSLFINSNISVKSGNLMINTSVFLNKNPLQIADGVTYNINNNFWINKIDYNMNTWINLTYSIDSNIYAGETYDLALDLKQTSDNVVFTQLNFLMPSFNITLSSVNGSINPSKVLISKNSALTTYKSDIEGSDEITITNITSFNINVDESIKNKIFVSKSGSDIAGEGSKLKPYASIDKAVRRNSELGGGYEIIVLEGVYDFGSSHVNVDKDVEITGRGEVVLKHSGGYLFAIYTMAYGDINFKMSHVSVVDSGRIYDYAGFIYYSANYESATPGNVEIYDCNFTNLIASAGVSNTKFVKVNFTKCNFINITSSGLSNYYGVFYAPSGSLTVNYCNFINITGDWYAYSISGNLDYNYWDGNDKPQNQKFLTVKPSNWVVINMEINDNVVVGEDYPLAIEFMQTDDGGNLKALASHMPNLEINLTSVLGEFNKNTVLIANNTAEAIYTPIDEGSEVINVSILNKTVISLEFDVTASLLLLKINQTNEGEIVIITLKILSGEDGTAICFDVNGKKYNTTCENETASIILNNLLPDTYKVTGTYMDLTTSKTFTVNLINTAVDVSIMTNKFDANITVRVANATSGNVTLILDGNLFNTLGIGEVFKLHNLTGGSHNITVIYNGNGYFNKSQTYSSFKISKIMPSFDVSLKNNTLMISLPQNATGSLEIITDDKSKTIELTDSYSLLNLNPGKHTIRVIYSGDSQYDSAFRDLALTIPKKESFINGKTSDITYPESLVINITVPEDATGTVAVKINTIEYNASISNGIARVEIQNLTPSLYTASLIYMGDNNYTNSTNTLSFNVSKASSNITLDVKNTIKINEDLIITAILNSGAGGSVIFNIGANNYSSVISSNNAKLTLNNLKVGNYTIIAIYTGDGNYKSSNISLNITVVDDTININANDVVKYFGGSERFKVIITDSNGNAVSGESVIITVNGVGNNKTTNDNGAVSIALGLPSGNYTVTVQCRNQTLNRSVTIKSTVFASDLVKMYRNASRFSASFIDGNGNIIANQTVTFNINGVLYSRNTTSKGIANLNINLGPGEYIITATNPLTGESHSNTIKVLPIIVENNDVEMYYRNGTQYMVKLLDSNGNSVGSGVEVTFNINGMKYERKTNLNGIARLNLNLQPSQYIITAEYNGYMVSNNINIKPVLSADDLNMSYKDGSQFKVNLVDGKGNPLVKKNVTFNINGILYERTTNSEGIARLNINLMSGEYIITSSYNNFNIANKITIF